MQLNLQRKCPLWQCRLYRHCSKCVPKRWLVLALCRILCNYDLSEWGYEFPLFHRLWIFQSHWSCSLMDIAGRLVLVSLQDTWEPHCRWGGGQVAERTQVQIAWVTWSGCLIVNLIINWNSCNYKVFLIHDHIFIPLQGMIVDEKGPEFSWGDSRHVGDMVTI